MPIVRITYRSTAVETSILLELRKKLQHIVATALNVPDLKPATLVPEDVELEFDSAHQYNVGPGLHILVLANFFEEREQNLQVRTKQISVEVKKIVGDHLHGFVYVRLTKAGFSEF